MVATSNVTAVCRALPPRSFSHGRARRPINAPTCASSVRWVPLRSLSPARQRGFLTARPGAQGVYQLADYLGFYYCTLPDAPAAVFLLLFGWLLVLIRCTLRIPAAVRPLCAARRVLRRRDARPYPVASRVLSRSRRGPAQPSGDHGRQLLCPTA
jgi:hypothetical protein